MIADAPGAAPRLTAPRTRRQLVVRGGVALGLAALLVHSWVNVGGSIEELLSGFKNMWDIISRAFPPDFSVLHVSIDQAIVSFETAVLGTVGALVISLPLTALAARNIAPNRFVYELARVIVSIARAIPDLIFCLIFVTAVGLGPFAGVLALAAHSVGTITKLFAEAVEDMDMGPVQALRAAGASRLQVFLHGVLPGIAPNFISLALYRFDVNVRSSLVLGLAGGGGIGVIIYQSMQLFQYQQVTAELMVILVIVLGVERISTIVRKHIV
jgi:phosphonate transport system permease protein